MRLDDESGFDRRGQPQFSEFGFDEVVGMA